VLSQSPKRGTFNRGHRVNLRVGKR